VYPNGQIGIIYNAGVCLKIGREALWAKIYRRFQFKIHLLLQNVLQNLVRSTSKSGLCRQKFAQDFSFKIHFILQNVLQKFSTVYF
jgi:hypothetical protein